MLYTPLPDAQRRAARASIDVGWDCVGCGEEAAVAFLLTRLTLAHVLPPTLAPVAEFLSKEEGACRRAKGLRRDRDPNAIPDREVSTRPCAENSIPAVGQDIAAAPELTNIKVWANYGLVTNDERKRMACAPRDMLIEQVQIAPRQVFAPATNPTPSYDIRFSHSIKALFFGVRNTTSPNVWSNYTSAAEVPGPQVPNYTPSGAFDPISKTTLTYENTTRLASMGSDFFSLVDPFYKSPAIPSVTGYHMYSYSLSYYDIDPLGSTNYGKLNNVSISPEASSESKVGAAGSGPLGSGQDYPQTYEFIILGLNNNIIRVSGGALGFPADHVGGVAALAQRFGAPVLGPAFETIPARTRALDDGDTVELAELDARFAVVHVPGHTLGHIAYAGEVGGERVVFCGDTLFAGGCGRLFEGTPAQMHASLARLAALPAKTAVTARTSTRSPTCSSRRRSSPATRRSLRARRAISPGASVGSRRCRRRSGTSARRTRSCARQCRRYALPRRSTRAATSQVRSK